MAIWACVRCFRHERRGPDEPPQILVEPQGPPLGIRQANQILDEHHTDDVVQVLAIDRDARVLLLAEERAQLVERGIGANRNHVGARRHDLAHERVAEIDDGPQQLPLIPLDETLFGSLDPLHRCAGLGVGGRAVGSWLETIPPALGGNQADERARQRVERPGHDVERRQQHLEHAFRIAPDDEQREDVSADEDEHGDEQEQQSDGLEPRAARQKGDEHRRQRENDAQEQARG
jgi:hypothetical protein